MSYSVKRWVCLHVDPGGRDKGRAGAAKPHSTAVLSAFLMQQFPRLLQSFLLLLRNSHFATVMNVMQTSVSSDGLR